LEHLARKALKRDTGARALRAVMEELMLNIMYELPERKAKKKYVINEDVATGEEELFESGDKSESRREIA
jgi:ATP-dependent Clp protease ATP-binding subunit ClpX